MADSAPRPLPDATPPLLALRGIEKHFPGVRALDRVDFTLRAGEIHSLLGENGAGKSTLIKVLTGVCPPDGGEILLDGHPIRPRSPSEAQALGISTVYQEVNLIPHLSVAENLFLGREPRVAGVVRWAAMREGARRALARLDLEHLDVRRPLRSYSIALQQMIAIARALDVQARVLVLDEPTSSLDAREVEQLFAVLRRLRGDGLGIVFVSHFLDQIYAISDRLTVLRNGQLVGEYEAASLPRLDLVGKMIGKDVEELRAREEARHNRARRAIGEPVLEAQEVGRARTMAPTDLALRRGEILGLAGLLGSGRTELASLLFGLLRRDRGSLRLGGTPAKIRTARDALRAGMGFLPEDRKTHGIIPRLSVRENIALSLQARRGWWRPLRRSERQALAERYIQALRIATPDADKPVMQLSGGNQQKVILARWLASQPRVLILDEPTRGVDVNAKAEIEALMHQLCEDGMAILFISGELEEIARDSDRVLVLRDRQVVAELTGEEVDLPKILDLLAQESPAESARA